MDKSAVFGIVITSICSVMLFIALFAPWFTVKQRDYDSWGWDEENDNYKWVSYDHDGDSYGEDSDDMNRFFRTYDSLENGKIQGFTGIITGMILGIALIVLGNLHLLGELSRRIIMFFRGVTGIAMLLPAVFLMVCGSKFTGLAISISTGGSNESKEVFLSPVPHVMLIIGIIFFVFSFIIISHSFRNLSKMNKNKDSQLGIITRHFSGKFKKFTFVLVILSMLALVTLPLLPIVSETDDEYDRYLTSGVILSEEIMDYVDFADYLAWVNICFWVIFPITLLALFAALFMTSGLNDLTGYIIGLITNLIAIFLLIGLIFKILFIVDVYNGEKVMNGYGSISSEGLVYGYNYLPLIVMIGLIVICILYMIHTIKGSAAYFRSLPMHSGSVPMDYDGLSGNYYHKRKNP